MKNILFGILTSKLMICVRKIYGNKRDDNVMCLEEFLIVIDSFQFDLIAINKHLLEYVKQPVFLLEDISDLDKNKIFQHVQKIESIIKTFNEDKPIIMNENLKLLLQNKKDNPFTFHAFGKLKTGLGKKLLSNYIIYPQTSIFRIFQKQKIIGKFLKNNSLADKLSVILGNLPDFNSMINEYQRIYVQLNTFNDSDDENYQFDIFNNNDNYNQVKKVQSVSMIKKLFSLFLDVENINYCLRQFKIKEIDVPEDIRIKINNIVSFSYDSRINPLLNSNIVDFVRKGVCKALDVARKIYHENLRRIYLKIEKFVDMHMYIHRDEKLGICLRRNKRITVNNNEIAAKMQYENLKIVKETKVYYLYSNLELKILNFKINETYETIINLSSMITNEVVLEISGIFNFLTTLGEIIPEIDVCLAIALSFNKYKCYNFPNITTNKLLIKNSYDVFIKEPHPHNYLISENRRFNIISGPNAVGKSSYVRQLFFNFIFCYLGAPLPTEYSELPIITSIYFIETIDDLTSIKDSINKHTLIFVDELRVPLALEKYVLRFLLNTNAIVYYITHNFTALEVAKANKSINLICLDGFKSFAGINTSSNALQLCKNFFNPAFMKNVYAYYDVLKTKENNEELNVHVNTTKEFHDSHLN
ncbi:MSH4 [Hepatospora eriocheir]|uniref:MSH4 n=1 Tax=Hepatospora eriocheir TaxID=1081669 RepID=A0A1X0QH01_9MICR|nr:MSH4 [Hepatospora eriocheir]